MLTLVKIEIIFITSIHAGPKSKPKRVERIGCFDFIIFRIATKAKNTPTHINKIAHHGHKNQPLIHFFTMYEGLSFFMQKIYIGTVLFSS